MARSQIIVPPPAEPLSLAAAKLQLRVEPSQTVDDTLICGNISAARLHVENITRRQIVMATYRQTLDWFPGCRGGSWGTTPNPHLDDPAIELDAPPLQTVVTISYVDEAGALQTLDPTLYTVDDQSEPARIMPVYGTPWPATLAQINAVNVVYTTGWMVPFVAGGTPNTLTTSGKPLSNGNGIRVAAVGGADAALPAGLQPSTVYYVVNASGATFQLAATPGGDPIAITGMGTGIQFIDNAPESVRQAIRMLVSFFYANRGEDENAIPSAVDALLSPHRDWRF